MSDLSPPTKTQKSSGSLLHNLNIPMNLCLFTPCNTFILNFTFSLWTEVKLSREKVQTIFGSFLFSRGIL